MQKKESSRGGGGVEAMMTSDMINFRDSVIIFCSLGQVDPEKFWGLRPYHPASCAALGPRLSRSSYAGTGIATLAKLTESIC